MHHRRDHLLAHQVVGYDLQPHPREVRRPDGVLAVLPDHERRAPRGVGAVVYINPVVGRHLGINLAQNALLLRHRAPADARLRIGIGIVAGHIALEIVPQELAIGEELVAMRPAQPELLEPVPYRRTRDLLHCGRDLTVDGDGDARGL
jgi:hypothetical protein